MRKRLWVALIVAALAAALLAAGCGGSGDNGTSASATDTSAGAADAGGGANGTEATANGTESSSNGTESGDNGTNAAPISKAAFIKQGDAICAAGDGKVSVHAEEIVAAEPGEREDLEIALVSTVLVPVLETDIDDIRALGVPSGDEAQVDAVLEGFEELLDEAKENPAVFAAPEDPSVHDVDPWREADKRAEKYGFERCPRS